VFFGVLLLVVVAGTAFLVLRQKAYRRQLSYNPRQNWFLGATGPAIETVSVGCKDQTFILSKSDKAVSGFLEVEVDASIAGLLADPAVEIRTDQFHDIQHVERGAHGTRFFNISRLLKGMPDEARVSVRGHRLKWRQQNVVLHCGGECVSPADRVLVIAPHPDDAEIAAFGLYADTGATVVTITAGDASDRYVDPIRPSSRLPRREVAKIRVWDS